MVFFSALRFSYLCQDVYCAETNNLFRARKTVNEMLLDRKYVVSDEELNLSRDAFAAKFGDPPR